MDAIKKKMQSLKSETENALGRAAQLEAEAKDANTRAEKTEEHVSLDTKRRNKRKKRVKDKERTKDRERERERETEREREFCILTSERVL